MKSANSLTSEMAAICGRIRDLAAARGMGRSELGIRAGVSHMLVYKVMQGNANLRDSSIGKFAQALDTSVGFLKTGVKDVKSVREDRPQYGNSDEDPDTVHKAINTLAKQFDVPEEEMSAYILKYVLKGG